MSVDGGVDRRQEAQPPGGGGGGNANGNGVAPPIFPAYATHRLRLNPNTEHRPDSYEDLQLEFSPLLFSSLERYLPPNLLNVPRDAKVQYMREILLRYSPEGERTRLRIAGFSCDESEFWNAEILIKKCLVAMMCGAIGFEGEHDHKVVSPCVFVTLIPLTFVMSHMVQRHREYRQKIISNYQPLHRELYSMQAANFFVPSFLKAINDNAEESFRNIMSEPSPGVFTFEMLQPRFCEMLLAEVENFEKWVHETKFRIMRPNTMNKYGAVLDDFGLETMLDKLMEDFIRPLSRGFHVDDSEVTLNVCLGKHFSGGELFFRGVRCDKHVNTETQSELSIVVAIGMVLEPPLLDIESIYYYGAEDRKFYLKCIPFCSHGILLSSSYSSVFRELKKYQKDFPNWCGECQREKKERQRQSIASTKLELLKREGEAAP
ncbi:hypothetical protein RJ639_030550 [Escallonia herrerae]|uniref:Uncharacterized protein n=1 Tax=Escallonia herrerae TaxID=1293975 RepID=A0AA88WYN1_9ASTE|nr:hypothetical protein RJ639_030550 [Escallonia herrerae]